MRPIDGVSGWLWFFLGTINEDQHMGPSVNGAISGESLSFNSHEGLLAFLLILQQLIFSYAS